MLIKAVPWFAALFLLGFLAWLAYQLSIGSVG